MRVVIDTNVFVNEEWSVENVHWTVFWQYVSKTTCEVLVPAVVIEETLNKYRERLLELKSALEKVRQPIGRLLPNGISFDLPVMDVDSAVERFHADFLGRLKKHRVEVLPWPHVSHEALVRRCNRRRRPFADDDRGYRDALIWETTLERITSDPDQATVLITGNGSDFCAKKPKEMAPGEKALPHAHLVEDLTTRGIRPDTLQVFVSLSEFNQALAHPTLAKLAMWKQTLAEDKPAGIKFRAGLLQFRDTITRALTEDIEDILDQQGAEDPTIPYLDDPVSVEINEVLDLDGKTILVKVILHFEVYIDFFMRKSDYYALHDDQADFWAEDSNWNESHVVAQTVRNVEVEASAQFDTEKHNVVDIAIDWVERIIKRPVFRHRRKEVKNRA